MFRERNRVCGCRTPNRSSIQSNIFPISDPQTNEYVAVRGPQRETAQGRGRRSVDNTAVHIILPAVAGAQKTIFMTIPVHDTAEMSADRGKREYLSTVVDDKYLGRERGIVLFSLYIELTDTPYREVISRTDPEKLRPLLSYPSGVRGYSEQQYGTCGKYCCKGLYGSFEECTSVYGDAFIMHSFSRSFR